MDGGPDLGTAFFSHVECQDVYRRIACVIAEFEPGLVHKTYVEQRLLMVQGIVDRAPSQPKSFK
jgi:hypothetical protein